ncbi:MAG: hypothetical protein GY951_11485 [Psychromonas sp.]|nr:hypothetical protein [Alteromonadales bacterium]MCP5078661.1 hypothetical protein [Psychromonas sp.]
MNNINYIFWIIVLVCAVLPFYLAGAYIIIEDEDKRKKFIWWGLFYGTLVFAYFMYKQMNVEFIYGKELLDYWFSQNAAVK